MKKLLSIILAIIMCFSMIGTVFAAEISFTDVNSSDWFYNDVKTAVEMGLVNGKSSTIYAPEDNLTYAEAIKLAACMNQLYTDGKVTLANGEPWYKTYVDYCIDKNIIDKEYNYSDNASRAGYMNIFANALPEEALKEINTVPDDSIPDVPSSGTYAKPIYKLYRAGILQGVDEAHNCDPLSYIKRSEVAAILTRMMSADKRIKFNMSKSSGSSGGGSGSGSSEVASPLAIKTQPEDVTVKVGETAKLNVSATGGKTPYSYQWQIEVVIGTSSGWFDLEETATSYNGQTTDTLSATLTMASERNMRCVITDANGDKAESKAVILKFTEDEIPLTAKVNETSVTVQQSESTILSVVVNGGEAPYTYQWQIKGTGDKWADISDNPYFSNSDTASLNVALDEKTVEEFHCIVTDSKGAEVTSPVITLTVNELPKTIPLKIKTQPLAAKGEIGETLTFVVEAAGGKAPYSYVWLTSVVTDKGVESYTIAKDNASISGAETETITFTVNKAYKTKIYCEITDADGTAVNSDIAEAEWSKAEVLSITSEPVDASAKPGEPVTFTVAASGGKEPYSYSWLWNNEGTWVELKKSPNCTGVNTNELKISPTNVGNFEVCCVVTDANDDKATTRTAVLTGLPNPLSISTQPTGVTVKAGIPAKLEIAVTDGTAPYTYQWELKTGSNWLKLEDNTQISGAKSETIILNATKAGTSQLRCTVSDANGDKVTSKVVSVNFK